jgi:DNA-binding MarR family transcriptional regulator
LKSSGQFPRNYLHEKYARRAKALMPSELPKKKRRRVVMTCKYAFPLWRFPLDHESSASMLGSPFSPSSQSFDLTNQTVFSSLLTMIRAAVDLLLDYYPGIFLACHRRHVRDEKSNRVLSARQASVLDHLDVVAPTHLHELAAHLGVTPSTMSLMIDRLQKLGYVRRSRDPADARRVRIRLTRAGNGIKQQQKVLDPKLVEAMLRRLNGAERESALAGLRILARAAAELMDSSQFRRLRKEVGA